MDMIETLEQQTAPESTRGLFDSVEPKPVLPATSSSVDRRRTLPPPENSRPVSHGGHARRHQRSMSANASDMMLNGSGARRNNFALQTLAEESEDSSQRRRDDFRSSTSGTVEAVTSMINSIKTLPSEGGRPRGHRKQQSMSSLNVGQTMASRRTSYNRIEDLATASTSSTQNPHRFSQPRLPSFDEPLSRDAALAEAAAKLSGTFRPERQGTVGDEGRFQRRPSEDTSIRRSSLSIDADPGRRRIPFNSPLDLTPGHSRRASRNFDDWRSSTGSSFSASSAGNTGSSSSGGFGLNGLGLLGQRPVNIVPFTPTKVSFGRDDCNPHQRRPLFIAHLPFSALTPLLRSRQLVRGTLRVNKRNRSDAYVYCDELDADIYVCGSRDRNRALEGDVVAVRLTDVDKILREKKEKEEVKLQRNGGQVRVRLPDEEDENEIIFGGDEEVEVVKPKYCGVVVAILERSQNQVFSGNLTLMRPNNKRAQKDESVRQGNTGRETPRIVWFKSSDKRVPLIAIPIEQAPANFVETSDLYTTRLFVGSIKRWPITSLHPFGTLEHELGSIYDLSTQTQAILADNNVNNAPFSEAVESCVPPPFHYEPSEDRRDLRDFRVFTIDPAGSNVLDDGLSIQKLGDDTFEVGVHVSDVSHHIKLNSSLDKEARARGVYVDLVHHSVPMLPERLTNQTNLTPLESRLALSVIWKVNSRGQIFDTWIGKTVVRSSASLTYQEAQSVLDGQSGNNEKISLEMGQDIRNLATIADQMRAARLEASTLTQKRDELVFDFGADQEVPVRVSMRRQGKAEAMVKQWSLLANTAVAQKISSAFPEQALLRRQAPPVGYKLHDLHLYCSRYLGVLLDTRDAGTLERSITTIQDPLLRKIVSVLVLKTLQSPSYFCAGALDISKYAHYALDMPLFTHFTAPSRRFSDLLVHRQLEAALGPEKRFALDRDMVHKLAQHCNVKKEAARYAREQSQLLFLARNLNKQAKPIDTVSVINREAVVVAVSRDHIDVMVPELNMEKRIHLASLPVRDHRFDDKERQLTIYWKVGVDTFTGKPTPWSIEDDEDDLVDEEALLEDMCEEAEEAEKQKSAMFANTNGVDEPVKKFTMDNNSSSNLFKPNAVESLEAQLLSAATLAAGGGNGPSPSVTASSGLRGRTSRPMSRRASIVYSRLSENVDYNIEHGSQTIKALNKIVVAVSIDMVRTPPLIRILAANPFA
ncbi:hypothetical protein CLU79DRAFT_831148 [Phycomyces nitens]|nr:hypothetical protein CLU79DRAFT_831148 [Phycomyces nitens]